MGSCSVVIIPAVRFTTLYLLLRCVKAEETIPSLEQLKLHMEPICCSLHLLISSQAPDAKELSHGQT